MSRRVPHLQNRNGVYYYRRRVPLALLQAVGKPIVHFSLNTSSKQEALRLKAVHDVRWDAQFQALARRASLEPLQAHPRELSNTEVIRIVRDYVREVDARRNGAFLLDPPQSEAERAEMQADADMELTILANRDDPRSDEHVYSASEKLFGPPQALSPAIGELVRQALVEIANRRFARAAGDNSRTHFSKIFDPENSVEMTFAKASRQYLDLTTVEAKANGVNQKWLDKQKANVATLTELVGEDMPVRSINFDICQRVRQGLAPVKHTNLPLSVKPSPQAGKAKRYVAYYRVSTEKQGRSGLGLGAQREAVGQFLDARGGMILCDYMEIESGRKNDRPRLIEALQHCQSARATLLIAKLDRLARSVAFVSELMEGDVEFVAVDMPEASRFVLHIMAAVAEHERQLIGERTKAALSAAKARGIRLGVNGAALAAKRKGEAATFAQVLYPHIQEAVVSGARTFASIAASLNTKGIPSREGGKWHPASVGRLLNRLSEHARGEIRVANDSQLAKFG